MITAAGRTSSPVEWRSLLPTDRRFVALPSSSSPLIVAERDRDVLAYVRDTLLAVPPRSRLPGWVYAGARHALGLPGVWSLAPTLPRTPAPQAGPGQRRLAAWLASAGHRLLVLNHSHDPDARIVVLLFPPGSRTPDKAIKLPGGSAAAERVRAEADRLGRLDLTRLGPLRATVPQMLEFPCDADLPVLMTTAQAGVPMLVSYHRGGHTSAQRSVRADFAAAADWLAAMQTATAGECALLDLAPGTVEAAGMQLADLPELAAELFDRLAALRVRLRQHQARQTLVHGDFWAGNMLLDEGTVSGVVDWERAESAGSPVRDLARFALTYSLYLDRHIRPSRRVAGHPGLIADDAGAGIAYAMGGSGWYPQLIQRYLTDGLERLGLPGSCGRDCMLAELAGMAAEATDVDFGRDQWQLFRRLCRRPR